MRIGLLAKRGSVFTACIFRQPSSPFWLHKSTGGPQSESFLSCTCATPKLHRHSCGRTRRSNRQHRDRSAKQPGFSFFICCWLEQGWIHSLEQPREKTLPCSPGFDATSRKILLSRSLLQI